MRTTYVHPHRPPRIAGLGRGRQHQTEETQDWGVDDTGDVDETGYVLDETGYDDVEVRADWETDDDGYQDDQDDQGTSADTEDGWDAEDRWDAVTPEEELTEDEAVDLLHQAHDRLRRSPSLRLVIDAVVDRLAGGCGSDVALMRRDDEGSWHVVAGSGLRTLEVRPLATTPPVLARLDADSPVLTIAQTDTIRGELAGLPLSRHRSLLVLRYPEELVTVLGRPDPFEQPDVELVTSLLSAALPHLERGWRTEGLLLSLVDWFEAEAPDWG